MHDLIVNQSIKFDPSTAKFAQCCQKTKNKFVFVYTFTQKDGRRKEKGIEGMGVETDFDRINKFCDKNEATKTPSFFKRKKKVVFGNTLRPF